MQKSWVLKMKSRDKIYSKQSNMVSYLQQNPVNVGVDANYGMGVDSIWSASACTGADSFSCNFPNFIHSLRSFHVVVWDDIWLWSWLCYYHGWHHHWHGCSLLDWVLISGPYQCKISTPVSPSLHLSVHLVN